MSEEKKDAKTPLAPSAEDGNPEPSPEVEEEGAEAEAPETEAEEGAEASEEEEEDLVPFHKHPRWQAREEKMRELESQVALMKRDADMQAKIAAMTPEEKTAWEAAKKMGLATKFDLEDVQSQHTMETNLLKQEIAIKDLLIKYPSAKGHEQAIRELASLPQNINKGFEEIYQNYFKPDKKIIKRTVKTGLKPVASPESKKSEGALTSAMVASMSLEEYRKRSPEILALMKEGKLS